MVNRRLDGQVCVAGAHWSNCAYVAHRCLDEGRARCPESHERLRKGDDLSGSSGLSLGNRAFASGGRRRV